MLCCEDAVSTLEIIRGNSDFSILHSIVPEKPPTMGDPSHLSDVLSLDDLGLEIRDRHHGRADVFDQV